MLWQGWKRPLTGPRWAPHLPQGAPFSWSLGPRPQGPSPLACGLCVSLGRLSKADAGLNQPPGLKTAGCQHSRQPTRRGARWNPAPRRWVRNLFKVQLVEPKGRFFSEIMEAHVLWVGRRSRTDFLEPTGSRSA